MSLWSSIKKLFTSKQLFKPDYEKLILTLELDKEPWKLQMLSDIMDAIEANLPRYLKVGRNLPLELEDLWIIPALQYRENSKNYPDFSKNMVNGEPINRITTLVPKGLGPWGTWELACVAAFKRWRYSSSWAAWRWIQFSEEYNGIGNRYHNQESTYALSFTNHSDEMGKFIGDGKYSNTAQDKRPGTAAIYLYMKNNNRAFFNTALVNRSGGFN